jgi:hypothetical protein
MATRFPSPVVRRGQVPLTQEVLNALSEVSSGDAERDMLARLHLVPPTGELRESVVLHALLVLGIKTLREARDEIGYAQLAQDPEYTKYAARARENRGLRRRPRHADDA